MWGHGFVPRFFAKFAQALLIKRYRCPQCSAVYTCSPRGYFSGFMYSSLAILKSLLRKLKSGVRSRRIAPKATQQYWFQSLRRQALRIGHNRDPCRETLSLLLKQGIIPCSAVVKIL